MKRIFIFLLFLLTISNVSVAQTPTKEELSKTTRYIENLLKRDSLNNLIIADLKKQIASDKGKTLTNPATSSLSELPAKYAENTEEKNPENTSLIGFIILAFGFGFLALLTPCVFPMVPLTVTFFTTSSTSRGQAIKKAIIYGISIVTIYTLIGSFTGPVLANVLSTHWIPNLVFFLIFFIFGLSFLGLFEITLPSSFINKVDAQSEKGGMFGVFFMAFTLVLVSFSCTVPLVGYVLVEAAGGITLKPILGMLAYSIAFAIPFTIFAMFPEWLKRLPKSGGWLNVIKVVLGFLEIALAFKFLSMVDQVYHLNILDREIYIAIWIVVFGLMGIYLLGKIRMPHDSEVKHTSVPRLILAMIPMIFVVYLIPGMFGAPLKALSGYLPPLSTHDFDIPRIIRENADTQGEQTNLCSEPMFDEKLKLPHGLKGYFTYEEALKCAKERKMPLFIDFTGHACTNCREVEANVWSDPDVLKVLKNDYVIASLYVDDRTFLPKESWFSTPDGDLVKTLGHKNAYFQISRFGNNAQPYYFLIDPFTEEKLVDTPMAYELNAIKYLEYLNKGLAKFKSLHRK